MVERAEEDGSFRRIKAVAGTEPFRDNAVKHGRKYKYRLVTSDLGIAKLSYSAAHIVVGLPPGWIDAALGSPSIPGNVQFDGEILTVHAAGSGLLSLSDEGHFVAATPGCVALSVRFVAQTASQAVMFGLACRAGLAADAPCIALLILPQAGNLERHGWHIQLAVRDHLGNVRTVFDSLLEPPVVTYGRLMEPVWLRLQRKQSLIFAQFSTDGVVWKDAGQIEDLQSSLMGIIVSSGISDQDTAVRFDSIMCSRG